jgi:RND family efflux transporter MFP subunit
MTHKVVLATIMLLVALCFGGCDAGSGDDLRASRPATAVQVVAVRSHDLTRRVVYPGSVQPVRAARLASPAEGPVAERAVREGDRVATGDLLVRLGRGESAIAGLEAAREEWRRQDTEYRRVRQMVEGGLLPEEQLETARAALRRAEAQLAAAETGAQDHEVRAPWDAVVSRVWVADGDYVAPRSPLVDIYDPASLRARIAVPELDARFLTAGTEVRVTADAWPGSDLIGRVERVYPELEPSTRTLTAEVEIDADVPLLSGMFVRVEVPLETAMGAVAIPSEAVLVGSDGEPMAFVMKGRKAALRRLTLGVEADDLVQVVDGVALGETLIVRGQGGLRDGMSVSAGRSSGESAGSGTPEPKADHEDN